MNTQTSSKPILWLAPMEGVVDFIMREFLTGFGGIDNCVTEFIRVVGRPVTDAVFLRDCPELKTERRTAHGVPVTIQLLGSDFDWMAKNALRAIELGAREIDLNFGCPAKTVNRHDGGATLLKSPDRLFQIVSQIRQQLPKEVPLSAKMRLGFENPEDCIENAAAIVAGGASHLTVHCRTKQQMYKPSADWNWISKIKSKVNIPIVANGDIFTVSDFQRCREITGCDAFMIGRGALRDPLVFSKIKGLVAPETLIDSKKMLHFFHLNCAVSPYFAQARTKQWLRNMAETSTEMGPIFHQLKVISEPQQFEQELSRLL